MLVPGARAWAAAVRAIRVDTRESRQHSRDHSARRRVRVLDLSARHAATVDDRHHSCEPGDARSERASGRRRADISNQVRLVRGNHDGNLTRGDIADLSRSLGGRIEFVESGIRVASGTSGRRTLFTHGHHHCMFNAPDKRSKWDTIPIGHFVTRAISYQLSKTLAPGKTAADTSNSGNPTGVDLRAVVKSWNQRDDLAAFLIEYICRITGLPRTLPIVMPDGSKTTAKEAARVFAGLVHSLGQSPWPPVGCHARGDRGLGRGRRSRVVRSAPRDGDCH